MLKRLREMRDSANVSNKEISDATGIPESTVNKIFTGVTKEPTLSKISAIVHYLGYTLDDLSERSNNTFSTKEYEHIKKYRSLDDYGKEAVNSILDVEFKRCNSESNVIDMTIELPMSELPASAGTGIWLEEGYNTPVTVRKTKEAQKANIVIRVSGDSMEPLYSDGDMVLVKIQPDIEPGEIGIFIVDNEGFIKKRGKHELISVNPEYDNIEIGEFSDCRCFGKVLGKAEVVE